MDKLECRFVGAEHGHYDLDYDYCSFPLGLRDQFLEAYTGVKSSFDLWKKVLILKAGQSMLCKANQHNLLFMKRRIMFPGAEYMTLFFAPHLVELAPSLSNLRVVSSSIGNIDFRPIRDHHLIYNDLIAIAMPLVDLPLEFVDRG